MGWSGAIAADGGFDLGGDNVGRDGVASHGESDGTNRGGTRDFRADADLRIDVREAHPSYMESTGDQFRSRSTVSSSSAFSSDGPGNPMSKSQHRRSRRTCNPFVACVVALFIYIPVTMESILIVPWLSPLTTRSWMLLLGLNAAVLNMYINYYLAVVTDPGGVAAEYEPPGLTEFGEIPTPTRPPSTSSGRSNAYTSDQAPPTTLTATAAGEAEPHHDPVAAKTPRLLIPLKSKTLTPRFCAHCQHHKPPRAHHCRRCRRCILRMDHHCPWIDNCVGFRNQAHFVRFLAWTVLCGWAGIVLLVWRATRAFEAIVHGEEPPGSGTAGDGSAAKGSAVLAPGRVDGRYGSRRLMDEGQAIVLGINMVLLIPTVAITTMLAFNQVGYLVRNQTTIESLEKQDSPHPFFSPADGTTTPPLRDPYDLGSALVNIAAVLDPAWAAAETMRRSTAATGGANGYVGDAEEAMDAQRLDPSGKRKIRYFGGRGYGGADRGGFGGGGWATAMAATVAGVAPMGVRRWARGVWRYVAPLFWLLPRASPDARDGYEFMVVGVPDGVGGVER